MVIYKFFKFLFQFLSIAVFVLACFAGVFFLLKGADFTLTLGENWYIYHDKSLYLAEPVVSRYFQPFINIFTDKDLWLDGIVAYLLQGTTYSVLLATMVSSLIVYILFRLLP